MKLKYFLITSVLFFNIQIAHAFTSSEGGFSISMPGEPTLKQVNHKSMVGKVKENSYTFKNDTEKYSASYTLLPGIAKAFKSDNSLLNKAKRGFLNSAGATQVSFQKMNIQGKSGRELVYKIGEDKNGKARFFIVGKKLYVMAITTNKGDAGNAMMDQYLNSLHLQ